MRKLFHAGRTWSLKVVAVVGLIMVVVSLFVPFVSAKPVLDSDSSYSSQILKLGTGYSGQQYFENVRGGTLTGPQAVVVVVDNILYKLKRWVPPILMVYMVYIAIRLMTAGGDEEKIKTATQHILYLVFGLSFIILSDELRDIVAFRGNESFLSDARFKGSGEVFKNMMLGVVKFLRFLTGGVALFFCVRAGTMIIFSQGEDEGVTKQKEAFAYGFVGLLVIMMSDTIVRKVVFPAAEGAIPGSDPLTQLPQVSEGLLLFARISNLMLSVMGGAALVALLVGAALYVFSAGNEEKQADISKLIYGALLALIVAFSAYTLVAEFIPAQQEILDAPVPAVFIR